MVRRWSYLNSINNIFFNQYKSLNFVHYEQSFKTNIVFKKEISPLSLITRKSWSRRKHLTNWLIYQNVLTDWSKDYIFFKKYNKFTLVYRMFKNSFFSYNLFLIKKLNVSASVGSEKIIFSSLTSKISKYCSKYSTSLHSFLQQYKNVNWLYVTSNTKLNVLIPQTSSILTPLVAIHQNILSNVDIEYSQTTWLYVIYNSLFTFYVSQLTELYKLSILLHLPLLKNI